MREFHDVVDHVVLEGARVAERWRTARWDALRLEFPNRVLGLPGMPYDVENPDGFAHKQSQICVGLSMRPATDARVLAETWP